MKKKSLIMRKEKNEEDFLDKKTNLIFDMIRDYISDLRIMKTQGEYILWIKRIITFIESLFPKTKKYKKLISLLKSLILNDQELSGTLIETGNNVGKILLDLARVYKLETEDSLSINLHPKVKESSLKLFKNGHYAQAVFESVKALNNYVKNKANIKDKDLWEAMAKTFNENDPIIKINALKTRSNKDEQEGFKFLFMGAMKGIRNPMGHEKYELDRNTALEYLAFISLLFWKAEEGRL